MLFTEEPLVSKALSKRMAFMMSSQDMSEELILFRISSIRFFCITSPPASAMMSSSTFTMFSGVLP